MLHTYCDKDRYAQRFVAQNMQPAHLATDMEQRNFTTNTYYCHPCDTNHQLPVGGIDVYVAGFPCTTPPWSRRGKRKN